MAVQNGDVLILDEIDRAQPEYLTALQAILEDTSAPLVLNDDGVREDLSRLNHKLFAETLVHTIEVDSAETMTALFYAYGFHIVIPEGRHFNTNTEAVFSSRIQPIIDLHLADTWKGPEYAETLYRKTITEYAATISTYRDLFSRILISTKRSRSLQTFQGSFNSRKAHRLISSPTPRLYTTTIPGRISGYDVSILVDSSGSMNESDSHSISKFQYAMQAMIILSESLKNIPGINFEVLTFTADRYFNVHKRKAIACPGDNVIYPLKAFHNRSTQYISSFYEFARRHDLLCNNFDLAAVKVASRRLLSYNTGNRKLLIVLSDGYPACDNNSSR